jgi:ribonuclease-3
MALTHRSYRFETEGIKDDNQRLEFLGDAVLGFAAAAFLYKKHMGRDEGDLTAYRSQTTSGKALAEVARTIDLGSYLRLGKGERTSGGHRRSSALADALEAVIGAAYLDGGMKAANKIFAKLFVPLLEALSGDVWEDNPKGKLQEVCQRKWRASPAYTVVKKAGPAHASVFTVEVVLGNGMKARGSGPNKRRAEMRAAANALKRV